MTENFNIYLFCYTYIRYSLIKTKHIFLAACELSA